MFYQVCRVSGKNSTPCRERRVDGTVVIEAALHPDNEMTMRCNLYYYYCIVMVYGVLIYIHIEICYGNVS